ncbi:MAG: hypothetical protein HZA09_07550 [Nitrospirae bacterium]|nr:hypothetical protein [Nitrospirota bacterium]
MNTQPKLNWIVLIISIAIGLFLIKPDAILADEPSQKNQSSRDPSSFAASEEDLPPRKQPSQTAPPVEGTPHAGEAGWSPEDMARRQQLEFYEMTPDGKVRKILDTGAIDANPPHRGAIFQVNKQTGDVEITKYDEGLTPADKKRLNNIARDNLGSVGGKTLNEVTGKGTKLTDSDKPPGSQKPTVKVKESPPSQSSSPEKTKISKPPSESPTPGKVTEILERHGGKITIALTAAMAINCVAQGKTIQECAIELAEGAAIGGAIVMVVGPTGAVIIGGTLGAWEIYKAGVEATQQWADHQQRSAAYELREKQTQSNLEKIDEHIKKLKEKIFVELQASMVTASNACRAAIDQVHSGDKVVTGINELLSPFYNLVSAIKRDSSTCKESTTVKTGIASLLSKIKNDEEKLNKEIESAMASADKCKTKKDADNIRDKYKRCIALSTRISLYSVSAEAKNEKLNSIIDKANEANSAISTAENLAVKAVEKASLVASIKESALSQIERAEELKNIHLAKHNSLLNEIDILRKGFPDELLPANEEKFNGLRSLVSSYKTLSCDINAYDHRSSLNWQVKEMNRVVSQVNNSLKGAKNALSPCQNITPADQAVESIKASATWALSALAFVENLPQKADACLARLGDKDARDRISRLRDTETNPNKPKGKESTTGSVPNVNVTDSYDRGRTTRSVQDSQQAQGSAGATQAERNTATQVQHERDKGKIDSQSQAGGHAISSSQREHTTAQQTVQQERQTSLGTTVARGVAGGLTSGVATGIDNLAGGVGRGAGEQVSRNIGIKPNTTSQGSSTPSGSSTSSGGSSTQASTQAIACNSTAKSGTNAPESVAVNVGKGSGTVQFFYNMFNVKDQMIVSYGGQTLFDTGCVSGSKTVPLNISGASDTVVITVRPACEGSSTRWDLRIDCPKPSSP